MLVYPQPTLLDSRPWRQPIAPSPNTGPNSTALKITSPSVPPLYHNLTYSQSPLVPQPSWTAYTSPHMLQPPSAQSPRTLTGTPPQLYAGSFSADVAGFALGASMVHAGSDATESRLSRKPGYWEIGFRHVSLSIHIVNHSLYKQHSALDTIFNCISCFGPTDKSILKSQKPTTCRPAR